MNSDQSFLATVKNIQNLSWESFTIAKYQRPYVWGNKQTRQLWEDIYKSYKEQKQDYRIGTIILHESSNNDLEVVDGQQRLTTLALLLFLLEKNQSDGGLSAFLTKKHFFHQDSAANIQQNTLELMQWISEELVDEEISSFHIYIQTHCSVNEVIVSDLGLAFKMFDSQNGTGLPLEAYNLIKAYHMRFMEELKSDEKITYDKTWEAHAKNEEKKDYLKQVINEQLYRTRVWSTNHYAYQFNKSKIDHFKGANIKNLSYPFQNYIFNTFPTHDQLVKRYAEDSVKQYYQITQPIYNGSPFFDYINTYVDLYKLLFEEKIGTDELQFFRVFYQQYIKGLPSKGHEYLIELYKSLVFILFDKFGVEGLKKYYEFCYAYVFRLRLEKKQVRYKTVVKYPTAVFSKINLAQNSLELNFLKDLGKQKRMVNVDLHKYKVVKHFFEEFDRKYVTKKQIIEWL